MPTPTLPEGQNGIAAAYLDDANIGADPDVLFADDFESYSSNSQLTSKWSSYYHSPNTRIATEADNVFSGNQSLEFTLPQTSSEVSNAVVKDISPTEDQLFVRVYTKFDSAYDVTGAGHNGIRISSNYPGPGNVPDGSDFFLFNLENSQYYNEGEPGYTHVYAYHPEQRSQWGDHWYPDGRVLPYDSTPGDFGPDFVARPDFIPDTNTWYSYELMVQANTPGARDGRVAAWIDGDLVADFQNLRMRDISSLKIDQIQLELHAQGSPRVNTKWYDDVVVARSYIGPMSTSSSPPTDTTGDDDVIIGDANGNNLVGGDGDDTLSGGLGEDSFDGGDGSDTVDYSYSSSDRLRVDLSEGFAWFIDDPTSPPGPGNEASTTEVLTSIENVIGSRGDNVIIGDANGNNLDGGDGNDTLSGGRGKDSFDGGEGSDTVDYRYSSSDRLRVDLSEDRTWFVDDPTSPAGPGNVSSTTEELKSIENVIGTRGDNVIIGDSNSNTLDGAGGSDELQGRGGNDTLIGGTGQDSLDGGSGLDTADYRYSSSDRLRVDLSQKTAWFVDDPTNPAGPGNVPSTTEELKSIENVIGTGGDNVIIGDGGDNILDGAGGVDTITGGGGNDFFVLRVDDGADEIVDYKDSIDGFLLDSLSYSSLDFVDTGLDTQIQIDSTNEVLAILVGVDDSVLGSSDFETF